MIELSNGRLIETDEEREARRDVLDWWRRDCGWGKDLQRPVKSTNPGPLDPQEPSCGRAPASEAPGYREAHTCLDCPTQISLGKRCPVCGRKDKLLRERERKARLRLAIAAAVVEQPEGSIAP